MATKKISLNELKILVKQIIKEENKINEIGPRLASKTLRGGSDDPRTNKLQKDAITSMFSGYIGRDKQFYIVTKQTHKPSKYMLIEVEVSKKYNSTFAEYSTFAEFSFFNEDGVDGDAPHLNNKKEINIRYDIENDKIETHYLFNRFTVNFLITAANLIREAYFTARPKTIQQSTPSGMDNIPDPNFKIKSRLNKNYFRIFNFDSKNLMN